MGFFQRISGIFKKAVETVKNIFRPPAREKPEPKPEPVRVAAPVKQTSKLKLDSYGRVTYKLAKKNYLKSYNYVVKLKFQKGDQYITITSRKPRSLNELFTMAEKEARDPVYSLGDLREVVLEEAYLNMEAVLK